MASQATGQSHSEFIRALEVVHRTCGEVIKSTLGRGGGEMRGMGREGKSSYKLGKGPPPLMVMLCVYGCDRFT